MAGAAADDLILTGPAFGADLDGTLKKIKSTNTITLGYRESSRRSRSWATTASRRGTRWISAPASPRASASELGLPNLQVKWVKVTVENRMRSVADGTIDLECGSTTASLSRQEQVDFSLMTFVDGGSLLVTDASRHPRASRRSAASGSASSPARPRRRA